MITIGTDIVDVERIAKTRDAVIQRVLSASEKEYCLGQALPDLHLAGRFAAKEAVFKALRAPSPNGISWYDIEIVNEASGAPRVVLHGNAKLLAEQRGMASVHISLSHVRDFAVATAVCEWKEAAAAIP